MSEKLHAFLKNKNNLIVIVLMGVLLMVVALPVDDGKAESTVKGTNSESSIGGEGTGISGGGAEYNTAEMWENEQYVTDLEEKLEELLGKMEGAGRVRVIITLQSSMEKIVEKDKPVVRASTTEEDAEGGSRIINNVEAGESTVYASEGNAESPYVVKTISPTIDGVLVLAEGAGSGMVSKNISDAIQALFAIEAHRIMVVKMDSAK